MVFTPSIDLHKHFKYSVIYSCNFKHMTTLTHISVFLTRSIYMQNQIASSYRKGIWKISTSETKILIALFNYGIFGIVTLSFFSIGTINQNEFIAAIEQYFVCEAAGSGTECDRSEFEQFTYSGLIITTFALLGFAPYVNLIFVINWRATKGLCQGIRNRCCRSSSRSSSRKTKNQAVNGMDEMTDGENRTVPTPMAQCEQLA